MEKQSRTFLNKRLEKALVTRETLQKKINKLEEDFVKTECYIRSLMPLLYDKNKKVSDPSFIPVNSQHITDFPFFARNSKYVLALYNTGVPVKCLIPNPHPLVVYTAGFHSKRLFFKHKLHTQMDDNYIFYTCTTRLVNSKLMFEIKTDDGLYIFDNKLGAYENFSALFDSRYEFEDIEDFFGMSSRELVDFIKLKTEN